MSFKGIKKLVYIGMVVFAAAVVLSSCNRGIGCPSDFSAAEQIIEPVVSSIFNIR